MVVGMKRKSSPPKQASMAMLSRLRGVSRTSLRRSAMAGMRMSVVSTRKSALILSNAKAAWSCPRQMRSPKRTARKTKHIHDSRLPNSPNTPRSSGRE